MNLQGRKVIITGAGQGIGRDYALAFVAAGAKPVLAEINGDKLRDVASEIETGEVKLLPSKLMSVLQTQLKLW